MTSAAAADPSEPESDDRVARACAVRRQGDVLDIGELPVTGDDGPETHPTPLGVVVLSQTCDIVLPSRTTVTAAPLVREPDTDKAAAARGGKRPGLVHVPAAGEDAFADLDVIGTLTKAKVAGSTCLHPMPTDDTVVRRFGQLVGRRFSRYPFPNTIVPWLEPLRDVLGSRAGKESSPEGRALEQIVELRVESPNWSAEPCTITLVVIVAAGILPTFEEGLLPEMPAGLRSWLRDPDDTLRRSSADIAARLMPDKNPGPDAIDRYFLWDALAEAWAARCRPSKRDVQLPGVAGAVSAARVSHEVVPEDEYPLSRVRQSEILDLDHLSPPRPHRTA